MGTSSSSSTCSANENTNERFHFRFTDCSCQCDASKKRLGENDLPHAAFLTALMAQTTRSQYDIREVLEKSIKSDEYLSGCDCDCGEGVKMGFLFGNTQSTSEN